MPTVQAGRARRVLSGHVLGARRLPLLDAQVGNVERRTGVHVVRAELVAQRPVSLRTRQRQVVQLEFVALVPVDTRQSERREKKRKNGWIQFPPTGKNWF